MTRRRSAAADYLIDMGPARRHPWRPGRRRGHAGRGAERSPDSITGQYLTGRRRIEVPQTRRAGPSRPGAARSWARAPTTCRTSPSTFPLGTFTCVTGVSGGGKSTPDHRHALQGAGAPPQRRARASRAARPHRGRRASRQDRRYRPVADRPHAALQPRHLYRRLHADPRLVRRPARGQGARLWAGALLVQRQGRALRGLPGRRRDQDRDAFPARRLCPMRRLQGQALQPRDARGHVQGQDHRRRARHDGRGRRRVLPAPCRRSATSW